MPKARLLQAVVILSVATSIAGCASSHEYVTKLFGPRSEIPAKDTQVVARFLELDSLDAGKENWVTTKITADSSVLKDSTAEAIPLAKQMKAMPAEDQPVAKTVVPSNRQTQPLPVIPDAQGTRSKRTRETEKIPK